MWAGRRNPLQWQHVACLWVCWTEPSFLFVQQWSGVVIGVTLCGIGALGLHESRQLRAEPPSIQPAYAGISDVARTEEVRPEEPVVSAPKASSSKPFGVATFVTGRSSVRSFVSIIIVVRRCSEEGVRCTALWEFTKKCQHVPHFTFAGKISFRKHPFC